MPSISIQEAREKGAACGVYLSGSNLYFCFPFRSGGNLQAAVMPFEDNPDDIFRICRAINKYTKKDFTDAIMWKALQFIKRSFYDDFRQMVKESKISNKDFQAIDSMILLNDILSGSPVTEYQLSLARHSKSSSNEFSNYVLVLMTKLSGKMLREDNKDTRLLHLLDSLSLALDFGNTDKFLNEQSIEYRTFAVIVSVAGEAIDTDPAKWYSSFASIAPSYTPQRKRKHELT